METEAVLAGRDLQGRHAGAGGGHLRATNAGRWSPGHPRHGRTVTLPRVAVHTWLREGRCRLGSGEHLMCRQQPIAARLLGWRIAAGHNPQQLIMKYFAGLYSSSPERCSHYQPALHFQYGLRYFQASPKC